MCHCNTGWQEVDCSVPVVCKQNCLTQGICLSSGQCQCYPGFSGSACQIYIPCPNNCTDAEHGRCMNDGSCLCTKQFQGESCELDIKMVAFDVKCPQDCLGQGTCNKDTGLCICNPGFGGPDCSMVEHDDLDENLDLIDAIQNEQEDEQDLEQNDEAGEPDHLQPAVGVSVEGIMKSMKQEDGFQSLFPFQDEGEEEEWDQLESLGPFGKTLLGRSRKKEVEVEIMDLKECPSKCNKKGICVNSKCFCMQGYTGERCQASKVRDLVEGYRYRNLYIFSVLSFILGLVAGFVLVRLYKQSQAQNEFKSVGSPSGQSQIVDEDEERKEAHE